ncbi:FAD/NAD(P)-binding domain-containing protein [Irpex rosettiformis]|uniref:FAD/NAD(P)-binding domain-containing protein n=1 Tax=Irpex rosettiformis TaxID=378272 RepID=A0ACB8U1Z3_9APHY|nr:FAD/NAD(P)-binding domain-containing protein [Irpex rosettiformis]
MMGSVTLATSARRAPTRFPFHATARTFSSTGIRCKPQLVILGSGWGGYEVLRGVDKNRWNVTTITPTNYFNFTPLLASCSVGTLELGAAVEPVRRYTPKTSAYQAWCDHIDFDRKILQCMPATAPPSFGNADSSTPPQQHHFQLHYDTLIIAVGAYNQTFNVPGVKEHAHFLKDAADARRIRSRILECFEQANQPTITDEDRRKLLHFCIVGGGPTGVEFAAELHDLLRDDISKHYPSLSKFTKISLFDVAPRILGSFDEGLQEWATVKFKREGINILTQHHVERVENGKLFVKEQGEVPFGLLVWSTGLAPNPLIQSITELKKHPKTSSLITDAQCRVIGNDGKVNPDVYAIGDAAMIQDTPLPATAQVANQKAKYLTKRLNKIIKGKEHTEGFVFHNAGSLAYLGDWQAVYDRTKAENVKTKDAGRLAWLLWRSAYFTRTLSIRNKILVPLYWFMNWIFGRDLTRF